MSDPSDSSLPRDDGATNRSENGGNDTGRSADDPSLTQQFRGWLRAVLGGRNDGGLRETIEELIEERYENGIPIAENERALLANILKLRDRTVVDAMVPRADIVAVEIDISLPDLIRRFSDEAHSRMPIFDDSLDDIVGMVHIKDVLACVANQRPFDLRAILRHVPIVAPSMLVLDLLREMRQTRQHMALVVDEFGGIDGLVTIEDLVEEIVGEIEDEHDTALAPRLIPRPDGSLLADARIPLAEFQQRTKAAFDPEEIADIDTLGGLVFALAGRVPSRGELLKHPSGLEFEIVDADPRRIRRLRVRNLPAPANHAE